MKRKIIWSPPAIDQLSEIHFYYQTRSSAYSASLMKKIFDLLEKIAEYPFAFMNDPYRINNDGSFRYVLLDRLHFSYKVTNLYIIILRVRHASGEPLWHD